MHYGFLTGDSLEKAPGRKKEERLYDVPEEVRA